MSSWSVGTDLRSGEGLYRWTLPSGRVKEFDSVTSVLKPHFAAGFAEVSPYMVALKAAELTAMFIRNLARIEAKSKEPLEYHRQYTGWALDMETGAWERVYKDVLPEVLLKDKEWLKHEGRRFLTRAAHRGSCCHLLLPSWEVGERFSQEDIKYWIPDQIQEHEYLCDEDETIGHALALNHFLHTHNPKIKFAEHPVFHDKLKVAGTMDGFWNFGYGWLLGDAKTSSAVRGGMAEQLAAYYYAEKIGHRREGRIASGVRVKMPRALGAFVLLVQPEGCTVRMARDLPKAWSSFKGILTAFRYNKGSLFETNKALGVKL